MSSILDRRHRKQCKAMSTSSLKVLVADLEPQVREKTSLLACAKKEYGKRRKEIEEKQNYEE